jgi:hypothetical protein
MLVVIFLMLLGVYLEDFLEEKLVNVHLVIVVIQQPAVLSDHLLINVDLLKLVNFVMQQNIVQVQVQHVLLIFFNYQVLSAEQQHHPATHKKHVLVQV